MKREKIRATRVAEKNRMAVADQLFGLSFPMRLEPTIFGLADRLSDYNGGMWEFYQLDNGGFYMAPDSTRQYHVTADNYFEGDMTGDALGVTACLYAFSSLSFGKGRLAEVCGQQYHLLREYALDHPEAGEIFGAID